MGSRDVLATVALAVGLSAAAFGESGEVPSLRVGLTVTAVPQFPELGRRFLVSAGPTRETLRGPLTVRSEPPELAAQVGVFASKENAQALLSRLSSLGFAAELFPEAERYRVLVPVPPGLSYQNLKVKLQDAGFPVIPYPRRPGSVEVLGGEGGSVRGQEVTVEPLDPVPVVVGGRRYRGSFRCLPDQLGPLVVNIVALEDYLLGVVPGEMGPKNFPNLEALKAQAVAARSYALAQLGAHASQGFDLCDQEHCQVYLGADGEEALASQAVTETRGEVLVYGGKVVRAYFHSTCGGHTEAAEEVFPGEKAPYLPGVRCAGEVVPLGSGWPSRPLDPRERFAFLARHLVGEKAARTPLEFASVLGQKPGRTLEEAFGLPDFRPLFGSPRGALELLWHFRLLSENAGGDPWATALQLAQLSGAVQVREGVVVGGEAGPRFRQVGMSEEVPVAGLAVLWRGEGKLWVGVGEALAGSRGWLWCTKSACPVVEVEASSTADARSSFRGWIREWEAGKLASRLAVSDVQKLEVTQRTVSGRVATVEITASAGKKTLSGVELRRLLALPSTWFVVARAEASGEARFRFFGKGWGHGVGLCQNGAYGLSLGGFTYRRILAHYYPGTSVVRWNAPAQEGGS